MTLLVISTLLFTSIGLLTFQFSNRKLVEEVHLPADVKGISGSRAFDFKGILSLPAWFIDRLIKKTNLPLGNLKRRLVSAGNPINTSQFFAFKFLLMTFFFFATLIVLHPEPILLVIPLCVGFLFPEIWLNNKIKKRQAAILRDLPYVIDLLNICVGAGLDFMLAVNRVIQEFRHCDLIEEFKILVQEMNIGSSRREALKNLSYRVNSPTMTSFVRTLIQADRMGTSIGEALKIQSEEIRYRRFQKGEEMALKAPIKLLFPLLMFILPVVLIIVAGPVLIQFTRGGFIQF